VILSYRDKRTERFARGERVREFAAFGRQAETRLDRLDRLDAAVTLDDLRAFAGNRLELLRGDLAGQHSIRINDQWRICFLLSEGAIGPSMVEIVDYH
jgi:toxin HigB-1